MIHFGSDHCPATFNLRCFPILIVLNAWDDLGFLAETYQA